MRKNLQGLLFLPVEQRGSVFPCRGCTEVWRVVKKKQAVETHVPRGRCHVHSLTVCSLPREQGVEEKDMSLYTPAPPRW